MDQPYVLRGHSRSMSSLTTIIPFTFDRREWSASSPPRLVSGVGSEPPNEYNIPLPDSRPGSEYGEEDVHNFDPAEQEQENRAVKEAGPPSIIPDAPNDLIPGPGSPSLQHVEHVWTTSQGEPEDDIGIQKLPMSLLDLFDLGEKEAYERDHSSNVKLRVNTLLRQCGNRERILMVQRYTYRRLAECYRMDKKATFASLYSQSLKLTLDLKLTEEHSPASLFTETHRSLRELSELAPWYATLSQESKHSIISFLQCLRNDTSFLADCLVSLKTSELQNLVRPHKQVLPAESALDATSNYGRFDPRGMRHNVTQGSDQSHGQHPMLHDPLLLMIHGIFDSNAPAESAERSRQLDVWSSVCARVVLDGKPGSDDFVLAVSNCFAESDPWTSKPQLELFIQDLIHKGQFLVEPQSGQQSDNSTPVEILNARLAVKTSEFFDTALTELVALICMDATFPGIPKAPVNLIRSTLAKIEDPNRKKKAKTFFLSRWFCTSFLFKTLVFPERHKMLLQTHIPSNIRTSILLELAYRLQKSLYEDLSPQNSLINLSSSPTENITRKLLNIFDPPLMEDANKSSKHCLASSRNDRPFLSLTAGEILIIAKTLFPHDTIDFARANVNERPGSMASSLTGSSTLTTGTAYGLTGASTPAAPSISGTSMTSNTPSSDFYFGGLSKHQGSARSIEFGSRSRPGTSSGLSSNVQHDAVFQFLPELTQSINMQGKHRKVDREDSLIIHISSTDGMLRVDLEDQPDSGQKQSISQPGLPFTIAVTNSVSPACEIVTRALSKASNARKFLGHGDTDLKSTEQSSVQALFQDLLRASHACHDYVSANFWSRALNAVSECSGKQISALVSTIGETHEKSFIAYRERVRAHHELLLSLQEMQRRQDNIECQLTLSSKSLRDKMWFVNDVRHSSAYEDTMNVMRALKNMAGSPPVKQTGVAAWARQRFRTSFGHERVLTQVFEALSAPTERCGPNKLADSQAELTMAWLNQESIENFCKGEERIHRFCFEIRKCVGKLVGDAIFDSPVLWSSQLYQSEKENLYPVNNSASQQVHQQHLAWTTNYAFGPVPDSPSTPRRSGTSGGNEGLGVSFASQNFHSLPTGKVRDAHTMNSDPGIHFNTLHSNRSTRMKDWTLPPSPISPVPGPAESDAVHRETREKFTEALRQNLTALLVSDLGSILWDDGSETDKWMNDDHVPIAYVDSYNDIVRPAPSVGMGVQVNQLNSDKSTLSHEKTTNFVSPISGTTIEHPHFSFDVGYQTLLQRFKLSYDPRTKLDCLVQLSELARADAESNPPKNLDVLSPTTDTTITRGVGSIGLGFPRTKLTRLEEVVANCEERRLMSQGLLPTVQGTYKPSTLVHQSGAGNDNDHATAILKALFQDPKYRPTTLFRDLQLIAAFMPGSVLDNTAEGTVFWNVGLAAMGLKYETCKMITGRANEILAHHLNTSNHREPIRRDSSSPLFRPISPTMSKEDLTNTTLEDAARLFTIAAMEGDPTAARELGLFYLTHPDLLRRVTLPLSKPSEVFGTSTSIGAIDKGKNGESVYDHATFAVAFHWMAFAANAGDADAKTFLKENTELGQSF